MIMADVKESAMAQKMIANGYVHWTQMETVF